MNKYKNKMKLNIKLAYPRWFFQHLFFMIPIWYAFQTQFASPATLGAIVAVSHFVTVLLELPTGALADLLGRKKTIIMGLLVISLSWFIISQTRNVAWLWVGFSIGAIGVALNSGSDIAIDYDSLKELGKESTYAVFQSKVGLFIRTAIIIGTFLGGYAYAINQRLPYILVAISTLIATVIVFWNTEPRIDTQKFNLKNYLTQTRLGFKQLFKNRYIKDFSLYYVFVAAITWYFMIFLNMAYATELGFSSLERSWLFSGVLFLAAIINYFFVKSSLMTRKNVYILFPALIILGLFPGMFIGKTLAIFSIFLVQFAGLSRFAILDQYANQEFESKYRATAVSSLNMAVSLLTAIFALLGGKLIGSFGAPTTMTILGVVAILTTVPTARVLLLRHNTKN